MYKQASRQKQALNTAAAAWYLIAESSGRGRELPIGWAAVALIGARIQITYSEPSTVAFCAVQSRIVQ